MTEPDWTELERVASEAFRLHEAEKIDLPKFKSLVAEAEAAAPDNLELTEFLMMFAPASYPLE